MSAPKTAIAGIILISYGFLSLLGLFAMGHLHRHSAGPMGNCPFMVGQQSLCTMSFTEHVSSWHALVAGIVAFLLVAVGTFFSAFRSLELLLSDRARSRLYERPHRERFVTSLFSRGILHPKAP